MSHQDKNREEGALGSMTSMCKSPEARKTGVFQEGSGDGSDWRTRRELGVVVGEVRGKSQSTFCSL